MFIELRCLHPHLEDSENIIQGEYLQDKIQMNKGKKY